MRTFNCRIAYCLATCATVGLSAVISAQDAPAPTFNRAPLVAKPYTELSLGAIKPQGWLQDELQRMAGGMTGHLDEWYPEVCGPRNAWLGGDGDSWERGPYWIDGLYPLAKLLGDNELEAKAMKWIDWTIENQREDGYIGPREIANRTQPPPRGAQVNKPDDWWPRMVMLKILQQHYMATGDQRTIKCLDKYFRYQLKTLPDVPLHDPGNPKSGSWWAAQRGGDNLMSVLWLYNVTGEKYLLELADVIHQQTVPVTDWFSPGLENKLLTRADRGESLHCVNLAQMMKTPIIRWQHDQSPRHLEAVEYAFRLIRTLHGQPHGLYGGDEGLHGDGPDRGSELCTAVEMMFSLEKMFEITGNPMHGDRLERITFNALPTQCTDDHMSRQYFQQTNQVQVTYGDRDFFNDNQDRVVYGLLRGYPCCTCNLHQGWPKFTQHLWLASRDGGLAAMSYAPSTVTAKVAGDISVTLTMATGYPFKERTTITVSTDRAVSFPLHLRIPGWAVGSEIAVNGDSVEAPKAGTMHVVSRQWHNGDKVELRFPMQLRTSTWYGKSKAIERGPLVYALDLEADWKEIVQEKPDGVPETAMHRGYREARSTKPWNYALPGSVVSNPARNIRVEAADTIPANPWTSDSAPVRLTVRGTRLPYWTMNRESAALPPLSPAEAPREVQQEEITLIPYGATTLRIATFPWIKQEAVLPPTYQANELKFVAATASHTFNGDTVEAIRMPHSPKSSNDHSIRRWTSWPQVGKVQWIEIDLGKRSKVNRVGIYWFDDAQGCAVPSSWHLETLGEDEWKKVETRGEDTYGVEANQYNYAHPKTDLATNKLRIVMQPQSANKAMGVLSVVVD